MSYALKYQIPLKVTPLLNKDFHYFPRPVRISNPQTEKYLQYCTQKDSPSEKLLGDSDQIFPFL